MYKNPVQSYQNQTAPVEGNPTKSEAWALTQAALKLRDALNTQNPDEMKAAVRLNLRLWTIFQADLLAPTSEVPSEIRQNMLSLANFVDKWSIEFMSNPEPKNIDVLININREIAGGLMDGAQNAQAEEQQAQPTPAPQAPPNPYGNAPAPAGPDAQPGADTPPPMGGGLPDIEA